MMQIQIEAAESQPENLLTVRATDVLLIFIMSPFLHPCIIGQVLRAAV